MKAKKIVVGLALALAVIAASADAKTLLVGRLTLAPFTELSAKVATLGTMVNNPVVPTLLVGTTQQQLVKTYGRFRADSPIKLFFYSEMDDDKADISEVAASFKTVVLYPSAIKVAQMVLENPGAEKLADDTVHLPQNDEREEDAFVKFTADGKFCAIAPSAALADRALADFAAPSPRSPKSHIVHFKMTDAGLGLLADAAAAADKPGSDVRMAKFVETFRSLALMEMTLDFDDKGISCECNLRNKPGAAPFPAAGFSLPAGVLDRVAADVPLFMFMGDRMASSSHSEAEFRSEMERAAEDVRKGLAQLCEDDSMKKYQALAAEIGEAITEVVKGTPYPSASDWTGGWLSFDAAHHPCWDQENICSQTEKKRSLSSKFVSRLVSALEKQWPGSKMLAAKADGGFFLDLAAVVDVAGRESGVKVDDADAIKQIENAKKNIAAILGGCTVEQSLSCDGGMLKSRFSASGVKPSAGKGAKGEARFAAMMPEAAATRPSAVFAITPYALARNVVLPAMIKNSAKEEAAQYKSMVAAMPAPEPGGALAAAVWMGGDGTARMILRLTADELKNLGSAFNAFTMASMGGESKDD